MKKHNHFLKILSVSFILLMLVATLFIFKSDVNKAVQNLLEMINHTGYLKPVIFCAVYILATILLVPGSLLTLGAGVMFGVVTGSLWVSLSSTLGAGLAFIIGRYAAREWVGEKLKVYPHFKAMDQAIAREQWKIVILSRLSPLFPFNLLNYAFSLTDVRFRDYMLGSWIGMMPGTVMYVYIGSLAGDLANATTGGHSKTTAEWVLYIVGLLATVMITIRITSVAKRSLEKRMT